jgi:hypothetical protein
MSLNRIYQGRISKVEIVNPSPAAVDNSDQWSPLPDWQEKLWSHHVLFQDAVNYYIAAIASLGNSPDNPLTKLRSLLADVWDDASKKGQSREGMGASFKRAWQLDESPTLDETIKRFRQPLLDNGVYETTFEAAGENMVNDIGGESGIQQKGRTYLPLFCDPDTAANSPDDETALSRGADSERIRQVIHAETTSWKSTALDEFGVTSIALPNKKKLVVEGVEAKELLVDAIQKLSGQEPLEEYAPDKKLKALIDAFKKDNGDAEKQFKSLSDALSKKNADELKMDGFSGASAKGQIGLFLRAFLLFHYIEKSKFTFALLKHFCPLPKVQKKQAAAPEEENKYQVVAGAIRKSRGKHGYIFRAFTSLSIWKGTDGIKPSWKDFDIVAFKEALKVWNQFKQNVEKREAKLDGLALRLLVMNGASAMEDYSGSTDADAKIRSRLERIWQKTNEKPKMPAAANDDGKHPVPSFASDPRIERLRKIINDDLAEEYRLTEGRKTVYGLRRRTMKGWDIVKHEWRKIVKSDDRFSEAKKQKLQEKLDELRGGEKREQIGSHKLFSALIADEDAWAIWREPTDDEQRKIDKNNWAKDPLEAFREYKETCDALDEISGRPLKFTPADARFSRRLFMFTDVCSFGNERGEYKHDMKALAVTVPVAIRNDAGGEYAITTCRLVYSAPRLLRDRIRESDGSYEQDWAQPLERALFDERGFGGDGAIAEKANPQKLEKAAVALMPDFDGKGQRRFLLNFPMSLDEAKIKERVGKARIWYDKDDRGKVKVSQFMSWDKGKQLPYLLWESDITEKNKAPFRWWEKVPLFRVLGADLGTRHTASIAVLECGKEKKDEFTRSIGNARGADWYARFIGGAVLRLAGEDARVLRLATRLDKENGKAFREELYGERGRYPSAEETTAFREILIALGQEKMSGDGSEKLSFPEQNDKLLVAVRRAQGWLANCVSWLWKLENPEDADNTKQGQRAKALKEIQENEQSGNLSWAERAKRIADGANAEEELRGLCAFLRQSVCEQRERIQRKLLDLTYRILPLRGRCWEWVTHPESGKYRDCHVLQQTQEGSGPKKVLLAGQRGLSIARIEQIGELRRRWQSLNQALRVEPGQRPKTASEMRAETIPDPCPDILTKLEHIREQRVDQTAHLILARALGLRLKAPSQAREQRRATGTHGEYEVFAPPVDFIVLEDLNRYLTGQGRAKRENSRLMKWCHRAITEKMKMLAEPFGIPVLQTQAAYTSRFCSRSGIVGFRAVEVGLKNKNDFRWRTALELAAAKDSPDEAVRKEWEKLSGERKVEIASIGKLFAHLKQLETSGCKNPTLLAPQPGGPIFVTAIDSKIGGKALAPIQADINAAANIALRAIAHPARADIHHRVRTERKKDAVFTREKRRFGNKDSDQSEVTMRDGDTMPKEKNSNLFYDASGIAPWGRARLETDDDENAFHYASGSALWKTVNDWDFQWKRCEAINAARFKKQALEDDVTY